jgi:uncharacterized protein YdaL
MKKIVHRISAALLLAFTITSTFLYSEKPAWADVHNPKNDTILLAYTADTEEFKNNVVLLETIVSHFGTHIVIRKAEDVSQADISNSKALIYYGGNKKDLPAAFKKYAASYPGTFVAIGENAEQFGSAFSYINKGQKGVSITGVGLSKEKKDVSLPTAIDATTFSLGKDTSVLFSGISGNQHVPLFTKHLNHYYFGEDYLNFTPLFSVVLSNAFYDVFGIPHTDEHPSYIRLEDIHPMYDPKMLKAAGDYLISQHIPFMMAVIPVYRNPKTGQVIHYKDVPELVSVIRYLQAHGGSVILHGYTHQYRTSETGEGFEFWDVENNKPIPNQVTYTRTKVENGIKELAALKIFPLAFEAPHYVMSQEGYKIISRYFSTYVGMYQDSDKDWHEMDTSPVTARPAFMDGMKLLPETISYYDPNLKSPIANNDSLIKTYQLGYDGMIAGFYHPYLGLNHLKELVSEMKKVPNLKWIDLSKETNNVHMSGVSIHSDQTGVTTKIDIQEPSNTLATVKNAGMVIIIVVLFLLITGFIIAALAMRFGKFKFIQEGK